MHSGYKYLLVIFIGYSPFERPCVTPTCLFASSHCPYHACKTLILPLFLASHLASSVFQAAININMALLGLEGTKHGASSHSALHTYLLLSSGLRITYVETDVTHSTPKYRKEM